MKMNGKILDVILAIKSYKLYLRYDSQIRHTSEDAKTIENKVRDYFKSLPLPDGVKHNHENFEKILRIIADTHFLNELCNSEETSLSNFDF